jgi:excisionase family DNA binding protein
MSLFETETSFHTAREIADLLRLNYQVVLRKLQRGEIEGYKIGKEWRVEERQLREWLDRCRRPGGRPRREPEEIVRSFFRDGRLLHIPRQSRKRAVVLEHVLQALPRRRSCSAAEVDRALATVYHEPAALRRELLRDGLLLERHGRYHTER